MEYINLEEAGFLEIQYEGGPIDAHFIVVLHFELQEILDKVASIALNGDKEFRFFDMPSYSAFRPWTRPFNVFRDPLIRAEITTVRSGSLYEKLAFLIPAFLAQPDVRAVLQNLVASVIFHIASSRIGGVRASKRVTKNRRQRAAPPSLDVGNNVQNIVSTLAANGGGKLTLKHRGSKGETTEVSIEIPRDDAE